MPTVGNPGTRRAWISLALILITVAVYWPVAGYDFVNFDDDKYIYNNPHVRDGFNLDTLRWALTADLLTDSPNADFWAPLTFLSHLLVAEFFGLDPSAHHVVNLLLHAVNTVLLFWIFTRMTGAVWPGAFVAALFAIHPLHVESVAWVTERKDVLSGFFFMLTLAAYVRYVERPGALRYSLVMLAFASGLMAKPMLVTLPFVLLLLDFWPLGRLRPSSIGSDGLRRLIEKIPLFGLAGISAMITFLGVVREGATVSVDALPLGHRMANAVFSLAVYLGKTLWPSNLAVFYPHPGEEVFTWGVAASGLALGAASVVVYRQRDSRPYLLVGWSWFLITLLPVIGIVQAGNQAMADRYTYIPLTGLFIMAAWTLPDAARRMGWSPRSLFAGAAAAVLALMLCAWNQVGHWRDSVTLFTHAIAVTHRNALAHSNLGNAYLEDGRLDDGLKELRTARELNPESPIHHFNLANVLKQKGQGDDAVYEYSLAVRMSPENALFRLNLGVALESLSRYDEAIREFKTALALRPDDPEAHNNLGNSLQGLNRFEEAVAEYQAALTLRPDYPEARNNLGNTFQRLKRFDEAVREYLLTQAARPDLVPVYHNLASVYLQTGRTGEAIAQYEAALRIRPDASTAFALGLTYKEVGRPDEARLAFERALVLDPGFQMAREEMENLRMDRIHE